MENHYFDESGIYFGSAAAQPGTLPPANALRVAPTRREGFWPVVNRDRDGWDMLEDHRGRRGWVDDRAVVVETLGSLPEGWIELPADIDETAPLFYLTEAGTYHAGATCFGKAAGEWLALGEIVARRRSAKPCGRCRPPALAEVCHGAE